MADLNMAYSSSAALIWLTLCYKLYGLRRVAGDHMRQTVCVTLFFIAALLTSSAPAMIEFVDRASGIPNLGLLISFSITVALAASARVLIAYWHDPPTRATVTARRWMLAYMSITLCMIVLFFSGDSPVERSTDFETYYATTPLIAEFSLCYLLAQVIALSNIIWRCCYWARVAERLWLKRGLYLIIAGSICGVAVSVTRITAMGARWAGADWDELNTKASVVLALLGLPAAALGFVLPVVGERVTSVLQWLAYYRFYRRLNPLCGALRRAAPSIVLPVHIPWWSLDLRLTRRLAEINDGRLAVRPYVDQRVQSHARRLGRQTGLSGMELEASVEAACLMSAIVAKETGIESENQGLQEEYASGAESSNGVDELVWLSKVSNAFGRSEIVAEAVMQALGGGAVA